jgi:ribose 5-phosphate isomerase B
MRIAIGSDHAAGQLLEILKNFLAGQGLNVGDLSGGAAYPLVAQRVGAAVADAQADLGVLLCGSGVGMSMAANKVRGVRAVCCSEPLSAGLARMHNDANVLCMGARIVGCEMAKAILAAFLGHTFEGGRHAARVAMLSGIENGKNLSEGVPDGS